MLHLVVYFAFFEENILGNKNRKYEREIFVGEKNDFFHSGEK
jgi:hypothetical protein